MIGFGTSMFVIFVKVDFVSLQKLCSISFFFYFAVPYL